MGTKMYPAVLVLIFGLAASSPLDRSNIEFLPFSTNLEAPGYRILDNVQPLVMDVNLDVFLSESRFNGMVQMTVNVTQDDLTSIVIHQKVVSILGVSVLDASNSPVPLQVPNSFTTDDYYEIISINFANPISTGIYTISINYLGQINENPLDRGFYRGYYYENNVKRFYATTQFQPYHARKAFPCFDEPQFKSIYTLSITRDTSLSKSYSNMPIANTAVSGNRTRETFYPTPLISSYLIAFHVSEFVETTATGTAQKPFGIVSRSGVTGQHAYAADVGLRITNALDEYFNINYYEMGQGQPMKNDHIALPDFPSGAMENWGMVNYREAYLLFDEANTNLPSKTTIATIMAHELGHKWFGNLVTCFWWSNLWLNESFASFFEYFGAHAAEPSLELEDRFVLDYVHSALDYDASAGANSMNWSTVQTNPSISAHFSVSSYAKGASVLRMLEHFVGPTTFKNALRQYLSQNSYNIGTPEDMYSAFRQTVAQDTSFAQTYPGVDIGEVFDSWVQTPGAPVLNVNVNMTSGRVDISQERFQMSGSPHSLLWQIPLTWTHSAEMNFNSTKPEKVLRERSSFVEIPSGHNWVMFNIAQSGLYRVNYDDHNWEMIAASLRTNREAIHKLNRAQIVNDVLYFLRSGKISFNRAFDVLSFLENEDNYYVWNAAIAQLDWLHNRMEHIPDAYAEFTKYLLELLDTVVERLGYNENNVEITSVKLNRIQILNFACNLGHEGCISDSLQKWNSFRDNNTAVTPNARRYVYCVGLREGDVNDYNFLFQRYNASENTADMVVILRALGCTRQPSSLQHYLDQIEYNDRIRLHDRINAFQYALLGNRANLPIVLDYLYSNYKSMNQTYGGPDRLNSCIAAVAGFLTDFNHINRFQQWAYTEQIDLGPQFNTAQSVVNTAMNNLNWGNEAVVEVYSYLLRRNSASTFIAPLSLIVAILAAHFINSQ